MIRHVSCIVVAGALLLGPMGPAGAATYRWIDEDGVVNLTNSRARFDARRPRANQEPADAVAAPQSSTAVVPSDLSSPREDGGTRRMDSVTMEVMRLSGLLTQVDLLAWMVQGEFERWRRGGFRPPGGAASVVAHAFSADTLRTNMHHSLARSLDQERTRPLLSWLRSPLSQRIVALETASSTAEGQKELVAFINQLPSTPPASGRLTLIHRLEQAGNVTQGSAIVLAAAGAALRRTLAPLASPAGMSARDLDGPRAALAVDENYRYRIMISLLFTYRELSDAELARYVSFLESPTGRWFTEVTHRTFLASLEPFDQPTRAGTVAAAGKRGK